ncbi:MAG TPA: hypothetical protein VEQ87_07730 [Burkholderiales bacterium]|nr:hypothetical protein [Burkholderiales bacterium]
MFGWFSTAEVDRFADSLVADMMKRVPPTSLSEARTSPKRFGRMTEVLSDQVRSFARAHRPNFYQRARLGNRVKWALKEAYYPEAFVDAFTTELITLVTIAAKG